MLNNSLNIIVIYTWVAFQENNLSLSDFDVICGLVSWAVCGTGKSREKNKTENVNQEENDVRNNK